MPTNEKLEREAVGENVLFSVNPEKLHLLRIKKLTALSNPSWLLMSIRVWLNNSLCASSFLS